MRFEQITIIGVGLIGGSVGLAAKARGVATRVVGVDRAADALKNAEQLGAIDTGTADLAEGVRECVARVAPLYAEAGASERLVLRQPVCQHDFPPEQREQAYAFIDTFLRA